MDRVHVGSTAQEMLSATHFDGRSIFSWIESDLDHPLQKEIERKIEVREYWVYVVMKPSKLSFLHFRNAFVLACLASGNNEGFVIP